MLFILAAVCEKSHSHSWISLRGIGVGDLVFFSHQDGIYGFEFPKRFWRSLPEISLFSLFFTEPKLHKCQTFGIDALSSCIRMAQCLALARRSSVRHSHAVITGVLAHCLHRTITMILLLVAVAAMTGSCKSMMRREAMASGGGGGRALPSSASGGGGSLKTPSYLHGDAVGRHRSCPRR